MWQAGACRLFLVFFILEFTPGSTNFAYTGGENVIANQGWRKHHAVENRQGLKAKLQNHVKNWQPSIAQSSTMGTERWASRDKSRISPTDRQALRRAELERLAWQAELSPAQLLAAESMMTHALILAILAALGAFLMTFMYLLLKRRGQDEFAFQRPPTKPSGFNVLNAELVHQALVVLRHTSTRAMDRACNFAGFGTDSLGRSKRQMKKDDPDVEIESTHVDFFHLDDPRKPISDDCIANSLMDLEQLKFQCQKISGEHYDIATPPSVDSKVVDSIVKPAENLKLGVQMAMDELAQFVDDDSDSDREVINARSSNLDEIDQLVNKLAAARLLTSTSTEPKVSFD